MQGDARDRPWMAMARARAARRETQRLGQAALQGASVEEGEESEYEEVRCWAGDMSVDWA